MTNYLQNNREWKRANRDFAQMLPEVSKNFNALSASVYKDGALHSKTKRLMALSVALTHSCRGCILFQTEQALELGASVEEVLEACSVAISVGGSMAMGETARVIHFLTELGRIE